MNAQGRSKNSRLGSDVNDWTLRCLGAVYMNQLMSFSVVAAPALMAVKQTSAFRDKLEKQLWALVTMGSIPVQVRWVGNRCEQKALRMTNADAAPPQPTRDFRTF